MKKIIIVILLVLFSSQVVFARLEPMQNAPNAGSSYTNGVYYVNPTSTGNLVLDLQKQVDELNQKNIELERKIQNFQVPVSVPVAQMSVPQTSPNDANQTQKIEALEKRVGIIETVTNGLKTSINKTLDLLTKLLSLLK